MSEIWEIFIDGACSGNPGEAGSVARHDRAWHGIASPIPDARRAIVGWFCAEHALQRAHRKYNKLAEFSQHSIDGGGADFIYQIVDIVDAD